ncbi:hypothetical protein AQUCO_00300463v1 [Aquilegia coerulea]|uniref:Agenet domain-containing protein n=1 Tax=Aquilegia coerulea TaxID=218851 RepID=A0A2G5EZ79_AQUCA|nr:hypothetical protein AQUCO_00300463v1 [Aquilegia coerulea]
MGDLDLFSKGMEVEVCSDDVGLRGAWFTATVLRSNLKKNKICVEYKTLIANEKDNKPLREFVNVVNLRPIPPREIQRSFQSSDEVDAYHNDGWWEGVVIKVLDNSRYSVYFRSGKEQIDFNESQLRIHREWVNGIWVPPMMEEEEKKKVEELPFSQQKKQVEKKKKNQQKVEKKEELPLSQQQQKVEKKEELPLSQQQHKQVQKMKKNQNKTSSKLEVEFNEGMHVEVSSDEEGFVGAWYTATVVKVIGKNRFLVEYQTLRTDDESELLKEEVDDLHIRPPPPEVPQVDSFSRLEEVDAMYHDGWWVGVISKVLGNSRYIVYFREGNEEIEFGSSQLRLHQDWINGKWLRLSEALLREVKEV